MEISVKVIQQKNMDTMQGAEVDTEKVHIQKGALQIILMSDDGLVHSWHNRY